MAKQTEANTSEVTMYTTRLSIVRLLFWPVIWTVLLIVAFPLTLIPLAFVGLAFLKRSSSAFSITSRRVSMRYAMITTRTCDLLLSKVETVNVERGLIDRLLGPGTIVIVGSGGTRERFPCIEKPDEFRENAMSAVEAQHART